MLAVITALPSIYWALVFGLMDMDMSISYWLAW